MDTKVKFAMVLVICGAICILASLGAFAYLFQQNVASLYQYNATGDRSCLVFAAFVGLPSTAVFVAGAIMVKIGIQTASRS